MLFDIKKKLLINTKRLLNYTSKWVINANEYVEYIYNLTRYAPKTTVNVSFIVQANGSN